MLAQRPGPGPQGWLTRRIGEFATECKQRAGHRTDLPVLSVTKHYGILRSDRFFSKRVHGKNTSSYKVVHPGQFAYATIHLNEGSIGKLRGSTPGIVSPMYTVFDVHDGIEPDYLFAVLKSPRSLRVYEKITQGTVNRRGGISFRTLSGLVLHHPPLPEQRKIAAILSSVDDAIEKTQAVIDQVQVVKRGLMQELLSRGLPGRHTRFKQTEIGKLPAGWRTVSLETMCSVVRGSTPRPARDPRFFGGNHVPWITVGEVTKDDWPFLEGTRTGLTREGARFSRYLEPGTVILTNSGVTLGVPKLLKVGGCANDGIAAFIDVSTSLQPLFLYYFLSRMTDTFQSRVARGMGQPNLNTTLIGRTLVAVPDLSEQATIADVLFACDCRVAAESRWTRELVRLKRELMSVLLAGELRVAPDVDASWP